MTFVQKVTLKILGNGIKVGERFEANFNVAKLHTSSIKVGSKVNKREVLGNITDPYVKFNFFVKACVSGYIINVNESPIVYQGDALFHFSKELK